MQVYKWHHTASWEFLVSSAPRKSPRGMVLCREDEALAKGGQRVICANSASKPLPICKLLPAVFSLSLRNSPRCPPLCSHLVLALSHVLSVYRTIALSSASPFACFHKIPRRPPLLSRLAAAPIVFFSPLRQNHCQYVNYCLRSFPCLCATPLAVRLSSPASPLLRSYFFHHCDRTIAERRVRRAQR